MDNYSNELLEEVLQLKKQKNALFIAHNYQPDIIQDIADIVGDSLELARRSKDADSDFIVFCGVYFMAETAKILSKDKKVFLPILDAGCPLADMITAKDVVKLKEQHPDAKVVCYVNSSGEVKAESHVCCTSANAVRVVQNIPDNKVIFIPDQNLGHYVSTQVHKEIIIWPGYCSTHHRLTKEEVVNCKKMYPKAKFVAHPECNHQVLELADFITSTSGMLKFVKQDNADEFIIGTEQGLLHRLRKENPDKKFHLAGPRLICPN
ncbi:quinolinate synthase NadA, partial [bacterium]